MSPSPSTFVVERTLPGMTTEVLLEAHRLLDAAARRVSAMGEVVRYLRCTFIPADQRCVCLFQASSADVVRRVNDIAQVPFRRIEPALEYSAPGAPNQDDQAGAAERRQA